jgi:hypothetical protein
MDKGKCVRYELRYSILPGVQEERGKMGEEG